MEYKRIPIGENISKIRIAKNITQEELVSQMQIKGYPISRSTLANIEAGRRNIKAEYLRPLKEVLGVEYEEFFKDE